MSDVKHMLIAIRACINEAEACREAGSPMNARDLLTHLNMARDALEAHVQAPAAVDREALAREIARLLESDEYGGCDCGNVSPRCAFALSADIIASGVLQDAAEVEARGLGKAADVCERIQDDDDFGDTATARVAAAKSVIRSMAQQVREEEEA